MKVLIIRHGEQLYPYDEQGRKVVSGLEAPLTDLGRTQMQELGRSLERNGLVLDAVYVSPILRAQQSAEALAEVMMISEIHVVDDLKEVSPNSAEGRTYEDLEKIGADIYANPFSNDQETLAHLVERGRKVIEFIISDAHKRGYGSLGIEGHGDPLCALRWSMVHKDLPDSYSEMKNEFYPQKGFAYVYDVSTDEPYRIIGEGKVITTKAAEQTVEGFRYNQETG